MEAFEPFAAEGGTWPHLDGQGRPVAILDTPPRFQVTDFGPDWVAGVLYDDLDVAHVVSYHIG